MLPLSKLTDKLYNLGGLFTGISKGLTIASWTSYGASMSVTVYHAIRRCEDYRPKPCKDPTCLYLTSCPDFLCQSSEKNKNYVDQEKVKMKETLDQIDASLLRGNEYWKYNIYCSGIDYDCLSRQSGE